VATLAANKKKPSLLILRPGFSIFLGREFMSKVSFLVIFPSPGRCAHFIHLFWPSLSAIKVTFVELLAWLSTHFFAHFT